MSHTYILNEEGEPLAEPDLKAWSRWRADTVPTIAFDRINGIQVSTIFLGHDAGLSPSGPPVLWETMVVGGKFDQTRERCAGSREHALAMHAEILKRVQESVV